MTIFTRSSRSNVASLSFALSVLPLAVACGTSSGFTVDDTDAGEDASRRDGTASGRDASPGDDAAVEDSPASVSDAPTPDTGTNPLVDAGACPAHVKTQVNFDSACKPECVGTTGCDLKGGNECCLTQTLSASCISQSAKCGSSVSQAAAIKCVQENDCPSGQVCCAVANTTSLVPTAGSECQTVKAGGHCSPVDSPNTGSVQLCQTSAECVNGETCSWQDCTIGGQKAQLTMCGSPAGAPFNCIAHN